METKLLFTALSARTNIVMKRTILFLSVLLSASTAFSQSISSKTVTSFGEKVLQSDKAGAVVALKEYGFKDVRTDRFQVDRLKNELCDVVTGGAVESLYWCQVYFRKNETTPALMCITKTYANSNDFLNEMKGSVAEGYLQFSSDPSKNTITLVRIVEEGKEYVFAKVQMVESPNGTLTYTEMFRQTSITK